MLPQLNFSRWSLTRRQLFVTGASLTLLALLLGVGGAWFIGGVAERTSDRMLAASVRSITETLGVEKGAVTLEMPPGAFGMLEDNARDNVYYSIVQGSRFLTGYETFPRADITGLADEEPRFRYDRFLGQDVRVVSEVRHLPKLADPVVVQVAETLDERGALARNMLVGLVILEVVLVGFAIFLIWPAIRWGLKPVTIVQREIGARNIERVDFTPLDVDHVPPELSGLIQGFNSLLHHLDQATARTQRFTADASHQMRTPLAVLRTHVELLRQADTGQSAISGSIGDIHEAVDRLQRLLTQLLALARAEEGPAKKVAPVSDAAAVARALCLRMGPAADAAGLEMRFDAEATFNAPLEPLLLEELLSNLIDNAVKYHADGTFVMVKISMANNKGVIEVEDDGRGVPPDQHDLARARFSRLPRDQGTGGSGLGLPIALAICEQAGATLIMRNTVSPRRFGVVMSFPLFDRTASAEG